MTLEQLIEQYNIKQQELNIGLQNQQMNQNEIQARQQELAYLANQINYMQNMQAEQARQRQAYRQVYEQREKQALSIENFLGKNVMAVVASLMMFIGLIVLCGAIIPYLNDTLKTLLVFTISLAITTVGCIMLYVKKNTWSVTLASCGFVSIYISLMISNIVFKTIGDLGLYVTTILWVLVITFLSRKYSRIFEIICCCGLTVSMIFSMLQMIETYNSSSFGFVSPVSSVTVYLIALIVICSSKRKPIAWKNLPRDIFAIIFTWIIAGSIKISLRSLTFTHATSETDKGVIVILIAVFIVVVLSTVYTICRYKQQVIDWDYSFPIVTILHLSAIITTLMGLWNIHSIDSKLRYTLEYTGLYGFTAISILMIIIIGLSREKEKIDSSESRAESSIHWTIKSLLVTIPLVVFAINGLMNTTFGIILGAFPLIVIMGAYGFKTNNSILKYTALWSYFISLITYGVAVRLVEKHVYFRNLDTETITSIQTFIVILHIGLSIITFMSLNVMLSKFSSGNKYNGIYKALSVLTLMIGTIYHQIIGLANISNLDINEYTVMTIQAILILLVTILMLALNERDNDKWINILFRCFSELAVYIALPVQFIMFISEDAKLQVVFFLIVTYGFSLINVRVKELNKYRNYLALYDMIKITIVTWMAVLTTYHISFVLTTASLIIAMLGIVIGFKNKLSYTRIYGLILSMLCTVKLTFFDISLSGTIGKAICLFICGAACFCISFVYSQLERKGNNHDNIQMYHQNQN